MAEALVRSPSSRQAGAFRARKTSHEYQRAFESYGEQQLSKFVAGALGLNAQSNPNWRTRHTCDDLECAGKAQQEKKRARKNQGSLGHSHGKMKAEKTTENRFVVFQNPSDRPAPLTEKGYGEASNRSDNGDFYQVYKHVGLGPFVGNNKSPLSLFEIGLPYNAPLQSLVKMQRLSEETGPQSGASPKGVILTPVQQRDRVSTDSSTPTGASSGKVAPANVVTSHDSAYQKMLQKLTRNIEQTQKGDNNLEACRSEKGGMSDVRHPLPFSGRRTNTSSDPCEAWRSKETADSGVCVEETQESVKFKTLNPRAREFLTKTDLLSSVSSHNGHEVPLSPAPEGTESKHEEPSRAKEKSSDTEARPERAASPATEAGQAHQLDPKSRANPVADPSTNPLMPGVSPAFAYGAVPPILLNHFFSGGSLLPLAGDRLPGVPGQCPPAMTTLPGLANPSVLRSVAGNILSFPQTPLVNTASCAIFPPMAAGSLDPCTMRSGPGAGSLPVIGPLAGRPSPVPKPRRPDPGDQQAYEAWIEWRKANEPGYALECKLRQQRRAQRKMTDQSKGKSGKRTDTSSSA